MLPKGEWELVHIVDARRLSPYFDRFFGDLDVKRDPAGWLSDYCGIERILRARS